MRRFVLFPALLIAVAALPLFAAPTSCVGIQGWSLVTYWQTLSAEGCYIGDKVFTNWAYTGPSDPAVVISDLPQQDLHVVNVGPLTGGVHHFEYVVSLYNVQDPNLLIRQVTLGVNYTIGSGATATKTLLNLAGAPLDVLTTMAATDYSIKLALSALKVTVDVTVPAGVTVGTITDGIIQGVPEPVTYTLIAGGLLALGLLRRKRA